MTKISKSFHFVSNAIEIQIHIDGKRARSKIAHREDVVAKQEDNPFELIFAYAPEYEGHTRGKRHFQFSQIDIGMPASKVFC